MKMLLAPLVAMAAGCGVWDLAPVGPSLCSKDPVVNDAAVDAVSYWNLMGTRLKLPCDGSGAEVAVEYLGEDLTLVGETTRSTTKPPHIALSPRWREMIVGEPVFASHARRSLAHELGHAMGFRHVDNPDAIMYWTSDGPPVVGVAEDVAQVDAAMKGR